MLRTRMAFALLRTIALAGATWAFSQGDAIDAACYHDCDSSKAPNGNCTSVNCSEGPDGRTACSIGANCDCVWGEKECKGLAD